MTVVIRVTGDETPDQRAERLARETVIVARAFAPDAVIDDDVLEAFWLAGYAAACSDMCVVTEVDDAPGEGPDLPF